MLRKQRRGGGDKMLRRGHVSVKQIARSRSVMRVNEANDESRMQWFSTAALLSLGQSLNAQNTVCFCDRRVISIWIKQKTITALSCANYDLAHVLSRNLSFLCCSRFWSVSPQPKRSFERVEVHPKTIWDTRYQLPPSCTTVHCFCPVWAGPQMVFLFLFVPWFLELDLWSAPPKWQNCTNTR